MTPATPSVGIRPGVSVLGAFRFFKYEPWFALAEFVDNSVQSFLNHAEGIRELEGDAYKLVVSISLTASDGGRIAIRDNAAGIADTDYVRAFRSAEPPPDRSGLSEFGLGMKSAACWFARRWEVRTSALGEAKEKRVRFDVAEIIDNRIEELLVDEEPASASSHFTEVVLYDLYVCPKGAAVKKIKDHLASIYRNFLRDGLVSILYNGEPIGYNLPEVLAQPYFRTPDGPAVLWRKEIDFDLGAGMRAHGFAALRQKADISQAGFALFRRGRLIEGSEEGYRPEYIFGKSNSFTYQRLFGELHLDGFNVSPTKDSFSWGDNEQPFLELLKEQLDADPVPLLQQAEGYRVRATREELRDVVGAAAENTSTAIAAEIAPAMGALESAPPAPAATPNLDPVESVTRRTIDAEFNRARWRIILELTDDPAVGPWLDVSDQITVEDREGIAPGTRVVGYRLSLAHPFTVRFGGPGAANIESLLRLAAGIGLAETAMRDSGLSGATTVRRNLNELLRSVLSRL